MDNIEFFPHLEIQIVEHCNLNCASCTHFSSLAEESLIDKEPFFEQLKKANIIFEGRCKSLKIMGGEPLLHPEVSELLKLARVAMPNIKLTLQTNGILLPEMSDEFWRACKDNNVLVRVTRYPIKHDIEKINQMAKEYNIELKFHPSENEIKYFNLYPLNIVGNGTPEENYYNCKMKMRYALIKNDKLYPCPIAGNAEHFNKAFGEKLIQKIEDSISLDDISTFDEYKEFATKAIPFCRYCMPTQYRRNIGWSRSKKSISEWV